jgi:hypothetical protein
MTNFVSCMWISQTVAAILIGIRFRWDPRDFEKWLRLPGTQDLTPNMWRNDLLMHQEGDQ